MLNDESWCYILYVIDSSNIILIFGMEDACIHIQRLIIYIQ